MFSPTNDARFCADFGKKSLRIGTNGDLHTSRAVNQMSDWERPTPTDSPSATVAEWPPGGA